jgi:hypothetical protein
MAVYDVAHVGSDGWVAVGGPVPGGTGPAVVWTSGDGRSWVVQAVSDGDGVAALHSVASRDDVVVALGLGPVGELVAAHPTAGPGSSAWGGTRIGAPAERLGVPSLPVAVDGDRFVTVVRSTASGADADAAADAAGSAAVATRLAWSVDGTAWELGPPVPADGSVALAAAAERVRVAVDPESGPLVLAELDAGVWRPVAGPPLDDAGPGPVVTGLSPGGLVVVAPEPLGEPARSTWRRVREEWVAGDAGEVPAPQRRQADEVLGVAARPGALVAVGRATRRPAGAVEDPAGAVEDPAGAVEDPAGAVEDPAGAVEDPAGVAIESTEARVWSSADGVGWQEVPVTSAGEVVRAVAVDDDGTLLAVGSLRAEEGGGPLWLRSGDGRVFERMAVPLTDPAAVARVPAAVVRTGDRWVAAGHDQLDGGATAAIWWSPDGATWTPAAVPVAAGRISSICGSGSDLIAVGERDASSPLVWRSSDGATWEADAVTDRLAGASLTGCEVVGADATVVGQRGGRLISASRVDRTWRAPDEGPAAGSTGGVARMPDGWVVTGSEPSGSAVVWRSADGNTWTADADVAELVGAPRSGRLSGVAAVGDRLLIGGGIGDGAAVLVRPVSR